MDYLSYFITAFTTIFVIVDPPGNIPLFIALTEKLDHDMRERISKKSTLIAASLLLFIALTGDFILEVFHISIDGLRIAGGILLFAVAVDILTGSRSKEVYAKKGLEHVDIDSLAVSPIALPLYTGPGAITAAIVLNSEATDIISKLLLVSAIIIVYIIVRITHIYSEEIIRVLGKSGSDIIARLMAIFLAAIGVEFVFAGLAGKMKTIFS